MTNTNGTYTSKRGAEIPVQPFPQLLPGKVQVAAEKKAKELFYVEQPTYDVEVMGGGTQTFAHDDKTVEGDEEATQKLFDYRESQRKMTAYINEKMMQFYLLTGTNVTLPSDDKWKKRQIFFGIEVPEDENELLYHYITTELLLDAADLVGLVNAIMEHAGIPQETLDAARASFRDILGEDEDAAEGSAGDREGEQAAGPVANLSPLLGVDGYGAVASSAVAMG